MYDYENNSFGDLNGENPDKNRKPETEDYGLNEENVSSDIKEEAAVDNVQEEITKAEDNLNKAASLNETHEERSAADETYEEPAQSYETYEESRVSYENNEETGYGRRPYDRVVYRSDAHEAGSEEPTREHAPENDYYGYNTGYRPSYQNSSRYSYNQPEKPKKKNSPLPYIAAFLLIIGLGIGAFFGVRSLFQNSGKENSRASLTRPTQEQKYSENGSEADNTAAEEASKPVSLSKNDTVATIESSNITPGGVVITDVSEVVEQVMPCLVAITDNLEVTQSYNPYDFFFSPRGNSQGGSSYQTAASGSGVIIGQNDTELLIVTNNHVVDNAGNYTTYSVSSKGLSVQFIDDTTADATVKGTDSEMDLAVIAVNLKDLSEETRNAIRTAVVGSSDDMKIGSGVICIGNAMGYGQSVTTGIISAKDREVTINDVTRLLLQTDAAINPGNSGGGMFNASGELIGINSAKYSETDVEGMCFAIPISSAEDIIENLMNKEVIPEEEQGYLGINGETIPSTYVSNYGYPEGVSVTRIQENSPAEKAGLQLYDIITAVNGRKISSMDELRAEISSYAAGTTVELTIQRPEGRVFREMNVEATLISRGEISISSRDNVLNS